MIPAMTDLTTLISVVQAHVANENQARFDGKQRLKVEKPKRIVFEWQHRIIIDWHYGIPNHFCVFIDTFDDDHNAAYVYVWEGEDVLKRVLITSYKDGPEDPKELPDLDKSLDDDEIARQLLASVIDARIRARPR